MLTRLRRKLRSALDGATATAGGSRSGSSALTTLTEAARSATADRDWPQASSRWEVVIDRAGEHAPARSWVELARALARQDQPRRAVEKVLEGRRVHPDHLGLAVEQARLSRRLYRDVTEDERHIWKARLVEAYELLAAWHAEGRTSRSALLVLGKGGLTLRRWDEAIAVWEQVAAAYPDDRVHALVRQAEAHRQAGRFAEARSVLEPLGPVPVDERHRAELERLTQRYGRWVADELVHHAQMRLALGEPAAVREAVPTALLTRGHPPSRVHRLRPVIEDLASLAGGEGGDRGAATAGGRSTSAQADTVMPGSRTAHDAPEHRAPGVVLVSGFLYSGSGAVFDHVRELDGVSSPFAEREVGFLKKPGNFGLFFDPDRTGAIGPELIVEAILSSVFGFGQSGRPILGSFLEPEGRLDDLSTMVHRLADELRGHWRAPAPDGDPAAIASIRRFLDTVVADLVPVGHVAVLNNAVIGHQLHRLRAFSDARAVAVVRDPRDQYVSQMLESPYPVPCDDFIAMMRERYLAFQECQRSPEIGDRVCAVRFEDFVLDEEVRRATLRELGLSHLPFDETQAHFRPEVSRRNVGIYPDVGDRSEVERVAAGLMDQYEELTTLR